MNITITITAQAENGQHAVLCDRNISHHVTETEVAECLSAARQGFWRNDPAVGSELGAKLFTVLNGSAGHLENALKQSYQSGEPLTLALELPFALDALPFEVLCVSGIADLRSAKEASQRLAIPGFLLLNPAIHLIRRVNDRHRRQTPPLAKRALRVLFMASSPRNAPERDMLKYEEEEESMFQAVEPLPVDFQIEDSGSLPGLQETNIAAGGYDVVHLSGHAGHDYERGPVFYLEDEIGDTCQVTPAQLWDALKEFPPRVLFLSGCSTGKSDKVTEAVSFAEQMVQAGIPMVLGWGLPVADTGATRLAAELYRQLGMGKTLTDAVAAARQKLADRYHPWPLLRVFCDGAPPAPLIAPGQGKRGRAPRQTLHKHLQETQVAVLERGFVGRRPEIQTGTRILQGAAEPCGLLIHGPAGVGKSCLAGKLIERVPQKDLIVLHGELKASLLIPKLRALFDRKGCANGLAILKADAEFDDRLKALFREVFPNLPTIFLFDDFEQNLLRHNNAYWLTPAARDVLRPMLTALEWSNGQANLILTSRYAFELEVEGQNLTALKLRDLPLMSLRRVDLKKKQAELPNIAKSPYAGLYLELGGGNPRLLEWLDQIAEHEADYPLQELQTRLHGQKETFILKYLADVLAQTQGDEFHQFLRRAAVFRQPVEAEAFDLGSPASGRPASDAGQRPAIPDFLATAVTLTLCERADRRGLPPLFWVTPVIRASQWQQVALAEQRALHRAAYAWYDARIKAAQEPAPEAWEEAVYHALQSGNVRGACEPAIDLGEYLSDLLLYREHLQMQQQVADHIKEAVIAEAITEKDVNVTILLNNLGTILYNLGEHRKAIGYFEQALAIDRQVFGEAHPNVAIRYNNLGSAWDDLGEHRKAIGYYEQALAIDRQVYGEAHPDTAIDYNNLGLAWQALGDPRKAIGYYEQALAIDRQVFGEAHPNVAIRYNNLGGAWKALGDPRKGIGYYEQALVIDRQVFGEAHPNVAIGYNNLGLAWDALGEPRKAIGYFEQALAIDRQVFGEAHPDTAIDYNNLGGAWQALGERQKAQVFYARALTIWTAVYGPEHPHTRIAQKNLDLLLQQAAAPDAS